MIKRRKSIPVRIGDVMIGGDAPVAVQTMTNTDTADVEATVAQVCELVEAGAELVRVTVNNDDAARAIPRIKEKLLAAGCRAPLIGDFHYNGHLLLENFSDCARALDKYRINPGNAGSGFDEIIEAALRNNKPVRIGANWGSLDRGLLTEMMGKNARRRQKKTAKEVATEALVESALRSTARAEKLGMPREKLVLSAKTSDVSQVIAAYEMLAERCDYPLHLGLTEAGVGMRGVAASSAALAVLLQKGIGDTIRISLTPSPQEPRKREVEACCVLLQSLGLRQFLPSVTSCPGCGRTENDRFQQLAQEVNAYVARRMPEWKKLRRGAENLKVAVMGCVVNGPGEAGYADIALSLPGKSEEPMASIFVRGKLKQTLRGEDVGEKFLAVLEDFVAQT